MSTTGSRDPARRVGRLAAAALVGGVFSFVAGAAAAPWGVPLGRKAVKATISAGGDTDAYMVSAAAGTRLDVTIRVPKSSDLAPSASLIGPDGLLPEAVFAQKGTSLRLRKFEIATTGRHEIRVAGDDATEGAYSISASLRGGTGVSLKGVRIGAGEERVIPFSAAGGAKLKFTVIGRTDAPDFVRIEGPGGLSVAVPPDAVRGSASRKLKSKTIRLPESYPFGSWSLVLRAPGAALSDVKIRIRAVGGDLPSTRGKLADPEPRLSTVTPEEAGSGTRLKLTGVGLTSTTKRPVRIFVGGVETTGDEWDTDASMFVTVPDGPQGRVDVALLTPEGHAAALVDGLLVVPPPRPVSFAPERAPAAGGTLIEVRGFEFRPGAAVTLAGTAFSERTEFVSDTLLRFTTPPFASGPQAIGVRDATGQEGALPSTLELVAAPFVQSIRPAIVPRLAGETTRLDGGNFTAEQTTSIGGVTPDASDVVDERTLDLVLPELALGPHDVTVRDDLGQEHTTQGGLTVFSFATGPSFDDAAFAPPSSIALADLDADDDLDVFLVTEGGDSLAPQSLVRVLRNDGDAGYVDVTVSVMPTVATDDWRGVTIALGDVVGDIGSPPPDGRPDLIIGTLDDAVLPATRSRVRILANRAAPGGGRRFVDRTDVIMSATSAYDDWATSDLWIGDLDGDGGIADIVATHDAVETGVGPLTPYYAYYLSGTRVFSLAPAQGSSYGRFTHQSRRFPTVIGTQVATPGFPLCVDGSCADTYTPFRGTSVVVVDLDDDGRKDVAVTTPSTLTVNGNMVGSTQIARNEVIDFAAVMTDHSRDVNPGIAVLAGDLSLGGDVAGTSDPDLVIVRHDGSATGFAIDIAENRGFGVPWRRRTQDLLPTVDGDEKLHADDAELVDIDGDGDLDLVLVTSVAPTGGSTTTGLGLRLLRNRGEAGFSRQLETLLPEVTGEDWSGAALAVGDLAGDGGLAIVIARANDAGTGTEVRTVVRTTSE